MTGKALDRVGWDCGYQRRRRESDHDYRERLRDVIALSPLDGSSDGIARAVTNAAPFTRSVTVATLAPGEVEITIRLPWWRRLLVFPARGDRRRIRAAVENVIAVGVTWELKG